MIFIFLFLTYFTLYYIVSSTSLEQIWMRSFYGWVASVGLWFLLLLSALWWRRLRGFRKLLCWEKNVGSMISGSSWEISHVTIVVIIASERIMVMFWIHFIRCSQEDGLDVNDQEKMSRMIPLFLSRTTGKMELLLTDVNTVIGACFVYVIRWWGRDSGVHCCLVWGEYWTFRYLCWLDNLGRWDSVPWNDELHCVRPMSLLWLW